MVNVLMLGLLEEVLEFEFFRVFYSERVFSVKGIIWKIDSLREKEVLVAGLLLLSLGPLDDLESGVF